MSVDASLRGSARLPCVAYRDHSLPTRNGTAGAATLRYWQHATATCPAVVSAASVYLLPPPAASCCGARSAATRQPWRRVGGDQRVVSGRRLHSHRRRRRHPSCCGKSSSSRRRRLAFSGSFLSPPVAVLSRPAVVEPTLLFGWSRSVGLVARLDPRCSRRCRGLLECYTCRLGFRGAWLAGWSWVRSGTDFEMIQKRGSCQGLGWDGQGGISRDKDRSRSTTTSSDCVLKSDYFACNLHPLIITNAT